MKKVMKEMVIEKEVELIKCGKCGEEFCVYTIIHKSLSEREARYCPFCGTKNETEF